MTRAEIRRHALAIAAIRKGGHARANHLQQRARFDRGYGTTADFVQGRSVMASRSTAYTDTGAVDEVFKARELSGRLPRGCWS